MYTFSSRLKTFSLVLIIIGALGIGYGFFTAPKTVDDVKAMMHDAEDSHGATAAEHAEVDDHASKVVHEVTGAIKGEHTTENDHAAASEHGDDAGHYEHVLMQAQNRPWTAIYVPMIFFLLISVCALVYYAIQRAASAGWSPVLFRVMEGVTGYIGIGSLIVLAFLVASAMHGNHMFAWMYASADPTAANFDFAMETKDWWLNIPGFLIRAVIYVSIWIGFRHFILKNSRLQDESGDLKYFKRSFNLSVVFLVVFLVSELFMAFDWLMSIDHHWFSQLYSFYVFASMFVSAITVIALVTIYLRSRGFLPQVNDSHIHDLAKYMFAFSIFWTYLWYAQFMLQWYANIPEEATYFYPRLLGEYQPLFIGMLIMNFVFPILVLMNSDYKRIPWFVVLAGLIILTGHYLDVFVMVAPGTVGSHWHFGIPEIGALLFFAGLFIFVVFNSLTKAPLLPKENPFIKESKVFHY
ncbi:quinol:cytochrome C oxidoreductase [Aureibaculum luteum]|uniref:quinol:cytochrome C oxidoreductase n=1 Tax=Aureibaculum luteum TaxID=1548456 RepID=UPI000E4E8693|nr:quinol:cytochrome C oxidoreductase [Aureibaculum luteum]